MNFSVYSHNAFPKYVHYFGLREGSRLLDEKPFATARQLNFGW
jgi:hypothetical protein